MVKWKTWLTGKNGYMEKLFKQKNWSNGKNG